MKILKNLIFMATIQAHRLQTFFLIDLETICEMANARQITFDIETQSAGELKGVFFREKL